MHSPQDAITQLVSLTALRDREQLDQGLAQAMQRMLMARSAGVYRLIQDRAGERHWFTSALVQPGQALMCDPPWAAPASLPPLEDFPLRQQALEDPTVLQVPTQPPEMPGWLSLLPLMADVDQLGVVEVVTDESLSADSVRGLQTLLQVFDNFQRLLESSQRDPLTGLLNRQTFDTSFLSASLPRDTLDNGQDERRRAVGDQWWLGVVDIDHFKRVNDRFGHLIGDEVLVLVARIMRQTFRHYDRLFRFGGEEFVVMLRCPEETGAMLAFERFRHQMASYEFPQAGQVTVSVGFTAVLSSDAPSAAFSRADEAVYLAKGQGRNQVLSHAELIKAGAIQSASHEGGVELF
jgi:diguanylate cyclase (GGDEF)-like protein